MTKIIGFAINGFARFFKKAVAVNRRLYGNSVGRDVCLLGKQGKKKKG